MLTVGQINERISELRSKIAVTEGMILHIRATYIPSESAEAELYFTRSDYGRVPVLHINKALADYTDYVLSLEAEIQMLESQEVRQEEKILAKPEKKEDGTQGGSEDSPAATNVAHRRVGPAGKQSSQRVREVVPGGAEAKGEPQPDAASGG